MKDKPAIKKIVFNVGGKTLELSKDEAKELKDILSDLFGEIKYVDRWHYHWPYSSWTIPCQSGAATIMGNLSSSNPGTAVTSNTLYLQTT